MRLIAAISIASGIVCMIPLIANAETKVDTALIVAIDASASVNSGFLQQQVDGHAAAFEDPDVQQTITNLEHGLAVRVLLWSSGNLNQVPLPWVLIHNATEAQAFAQSLRTIRLPAVAGTTAIGAALMDCAAIFRQMNFPADKKVVDIVSNGFSNSGPDPAPIRDRMAAQGVTINGLAILDEMPWLEQYFAQSVIGGVAPFVTHIDNRDDYVNALRRKLIQELS